MLFHTLALSINYMDFNAPMSEPRYWDEAERTAARQLEAIAAPLRSPQLQVETRTLRGYPADAILTEAERIQPDLIAIGTVGRSGVKRFLMGSVAARVLDQASCPVLTVRKPDEHEPVQVSVE